MAINNEIQKTSVNWSSLNQSIQNSAINWTSIVNQEILTKGINWANINGYSEGKTLKVRTSVNGGLNWE